MQSFFTPEVRLELHRLQTACHSVAHLPFCVVRWRDNIECLDLIGLNAAKKTRHSTYIYLWVWHNDNGRHSRCKPCVPIFCKQSVLNHATAFSYKKRSILTKECKKKNPIVTYSRWLTASSMFNTSLVTLNSNFKQILKLHCLYEI